MERGGQDTGDKRTRKGPKNRKCRKNERRKRKKQKRMWATTQDRKETEQKEKRNRKESEMHGEGCEKGEREPGRGHQRTSELSEIGRAHV